jgi:hypothetical protein
MTVCFRCHQCNAELTIDLSNCQHTDRFRMKPPETGYDFEYPFCRAPFENALRAAVDVYCNFLYHLGQAKQPAIFRLQEPPADRPPVKLRHYRLSRSFEGTNRSYGSMTRTLGARLARQP